MSEIFLVGLSHHTAPLEVREHLSVATEATKEQLGQLLSGPLHECVLLSTCNRVEVYGTSPTPSEAVAHVREHLCRRAPADIQGLLYEHVGVHAVHHAFRVASSLDSMVVGEPQILGQIKTAFQNAEAAGAVGGLLTRCFQHAFGAAKRARNETGIAKGFVSVSSIAVELAEKIFGALEGRNALLVGAGEMSEAAAKSLSSKGAKLVVVNRSLERAEELARAVGGQPRPYEQLFLELTQADVVVSSTASPTFIIEPTLLREVIRSRRGRPLFLIDIAVPRDIDPRCGSLANVYLYDVDDLQRVAADNVAARRTEATLAESVIKEEASSFEEWRQSLSLRPTIVALRSHFQDVARSELERTLPRLKTLSPEDHVALTKMTDALVSKLLHQPMSELKGSTPGREAARLIDATQRLFDLDTSDSSTAKTNPPQREVAPIAQDAPLTNGDAHIAEADEVNHENNESPDTIVSGLAGAQQAAGAKGNGR